MSARDEILAVGRLDLADVVRSRWLAVCVLFYLLLAGIFVLVGLRESSVLGFTGMSRVLFSLTPADTPARLLVPTTVVKACLSGVLPLAAGLAIEWAIGQGLPRADVYAVLFALLCVGIVAGVALADTLLGLVARTINDLYFTLQVTTLRIDPLSLAKGVVLGVAATLAAAAVPALEAARVTPRAAMSRSTVEHRHRALARRGVAVGSVMMLGAAAVIALPGSGLLMGFFDPS